MRILIIDDDENYRELLREIIRRMGHTVETAATAFEGLENLQKNLYSLLIVDYQIPGMTGLELIQEIRRSDQELQIVVISGYDSFPHDQNSANLNLTGYFTKPIDFEKFEILIQKISTPL
jgi:YesN/AraC family two-component response regulator